MSTDFHSKVLLSKYRGRDRTIWSEADHERFSRQDRLNGTAIVTDGNILDDYAFEEGHCTLDTRSHNNVVHQIDYCRRQSIALKNVFRAFDETVQARRREQESNVSSTRPRPLSAIWIRSTAATVCDKLKKLLNTVELPSVSPSSSVSSSNGRNRQPLDASSEQNRVRHTFRDMVSQYRQQQQFKNMLITGPPGVGKSYLTRLLMQDGQDANGSVPATSFNGLTTVNIGGCDTVAGLISCSWEKEKATTTLRAWHPVNDKGKLEEFCRKVDIERIVAIIIDEISNVSPIYLAALSKRFQQATGNYESHFGGIPAVLVGDFSQLPPVQGTSLVRALLDAELHDKRKQKEHSRLRGTKRRGIKRTRQS